MTKPTLENYRDGYNRIYSWLRAKHPEILAEYRTDIKQDAERANRILKESLQG